MSWFINMIYVFFGVGLAFNLLGALSLHRFPDVYTRLHGTTKCTTFGSIFLYAGVILYAFPFLGEAFIPFSIHVIILMFMIMVTSSTGAHAIARASYRSGILPKMVVVDRLKEDRRKSNDF